MAKRKRPTTALTAFLFEHNMSTYYLQKNGFINAGHVHNAAKRNVKTYTIHFLNQIAKPVHMNWMTVGQSLLRLQKLFPPKEKHDLRHGQGGNKKNNRIHKERMKKASEK